MMTGLGQVCATCEHFVGDPSRYSIGLCRLEALRLDSTDLLEMEFDQGVIRLMRVYAVRYGTCEHWQPVDGRGGGMNTRYTRALAWIRRQARADMIALVGER